MHLHIIIMVALILAFKIGKEYGRETELRMVKRKAREAAIKLPRARKV